MGDHQDMLSGVLVEDLIQGTDYAGGKCVQWLGARRAVSHRVGVEGVILDRGGGNQFIRRAPLPLTEADFAQIIQHLQRQATLCRNLGGEGTTTLQWRTYHPLPAGYGRGRRAHLVPALGGQWVVDSVATKASPTDRFAVAQEIADGGRLWMHAQLTEMVVGAYNNSLQLCETPIMQSKTYGGIDNDPTGAMNPTGNIIRDAWVFGLIPETETCAGWTLQGLESLYDKVSKAWEPYGNLASQLPAELRERHARIYAAAVTQARDKGWDPELAEND